MGDSEELKSWLDTVGALRVLDEVMEVTAESAWFIVDDKKHLLHWSRGAEALLGFEASQVLGESCLTAHRCVNCMKQCGLEAHRTIDGARLSMIRRDGNVVDVIKTARSFWSDGGRFLGGVELLRRAPQEVERRDGPADAQGELPNGAMDFYGLLTRDPKMLETIDIIQHLAKNDVSVLVRGESGTGKELIARALHLESRRKSGPFVAINCAALSETLLESELFGHERGAFTGATSRHQGVFEQADGGTLFLDEVGELPPNTQAKLLRVLEERAFQRLGGKKRIHVDVRIISATHRSLRHEVEAGRFREDLMFRLRVVPVFLPPLRQRSVDITLLLDALVDRRRQTGQRAIRGFTPEAVQRLLDYHWPGNVRELNNVIDYAIAVGRSDWVGVEGLPPELRSDVVQDEPRQDADVGSRRYRGRTGVREEEAIREALSEHDGDVGKAAQALGMSRPTFWRRRKKYGIS